MWKLVAICAAFAVMKKTEAGYVGAGASAGSSAHAGGYGGGYGGSYSNDYDDGGFYFPGAAYAYGGIQDPYAFHQQLTSSILRQNAAHQNAIATATTTGGATANADASLFPLTMDEYVRHNGPSGHGVYFGGSKSAPVPTAGSKVFNGKPAAAHTSSNHGASSTASHSNGHGSNVVFGTSHGSGAGHGSNHGSGHGSSAGTGHGASYGSGGNQGSSHGAGYGAGHGTGYASSYGSGSGGNTHYAAASGSIGPGGYHQTASIHPQNPAFPNISKRFGGSDNDGGFKGVAVSSFSSSSNVNGKPVNVRGATTTVNDNGKVTTYSVHS